MTVLVAAPFIGSFLGTLVARYPSEESVVGGRSRCPQCNATLAPWELVPVLSWLLQRGRCRHCGNAVSVFYPAIELAALSIAVWAATVYAGWQLWAVSLVGWALLALALIDYRHFKLPNMLTLPLLIGGLVFAGLSGTDAFIGSAIGALLGYGIFAGVGVLYQRLRGRDGLGLGDAKLLGAAGAWVTWAGLPSIILVASLGAIGAVLGQACLAGRLDIRKEIPYGPYLSLATWLVVLYGPLVP